MDTRTMYGRRVITTDVKEITAANVVEVLQKAMNDHNQNRGEMEYLWNYYRGKQPILTRAKTVRPEICNKIIENRANEIVSFKVGYLCGEPIQYVGRNSDESVTDGITTLNEYMFLVDKPSLDKEIVEWQMITGTRTMRNRKLEGSIISNTTIACSCTQANFNECGVLPVDVFQIQLCHDVIGGIIVSIFETSAFMVTRYATENLISERS